MIRVLIVDDSATMRALLMARLSEESDIEVVAAAADPIEARTLMRSLNPDVVTLDIEMPRMNGLDFLDKIVRLRPTPVIIVSDSTLAGADATTRALEIGAVDCYSKRDRSGRLLVDDGGRLARLIRSAAQVTISSRHPTHVPDLKVVPVRASSDAATRLIAIGASTGGVEALQVVLSAFPPDCPPTVIVQHINAKFAPAVVRRLNEHCPARVQLAESDLPLKRGHIYLAPGGDCHFVVRGVNRLFSKLRVGQSISGHRPSIDVLFESVATAAPGESVGILLTGMGADGAHGLLAMRRVGCRTIAQDEASSTVYGMPRAAIERGAATMVLPLEKIGHCALARSGSQ